MCPFGILLGLLVVLGGLVYLYFKRKLAQKMSYWPNRGVPFFDTWKLCSLWDRLSAKYALHELDHMIYKEVQRKGIQDYCGQIELGNVVFYVMDLELIKSILVKDFDSFVDRRIFDTEKTDPYLFKMLSNTKGQEWKNLRSTMSPTFTTGKIRRMYPIFEASSDKLAQYLKKELQTKFEFEFREIFTRYTLDVISSTAFGLDSQSFQNEESQFTKWARRFQNQFNGIKAFKFILAVVMPKLFSILRIPLLDQQATNFFAEVVRQAIRHRRLTNEKRDDFLQLIMDAGEEGDTTSTATDEATSVYDQDAQLKSTHSKVPLTEDVILSQCLLFFLAGFDTIETLLLAVGYELALNHDVQDRLHKELKEAWDLDEGKLSYDTIMQLEYLDMVVSEALRKYPPGIRLERRATKTYRLPNTEIVIENDTIVVVPVYGMHLDERYFPNPHKFDPERFTADNKSKRHPYVYLPFGVGPRNCIAMRFALAEGKAALAHLILNFKLQPSAKTEIPISFTKTGAFKPANGLWLRVIPR